MLVSIPNVSFTTRTTNYQDIIYLLMQLLNTPHPKSTMISSVVTIKKGMKEKKWIKKKNVVGSVVKVKVGDIEENAR